MDGEARFAVDLFRGTAADYDRYRLGYPPEMLASIVGRVSPSGHGRLLDLACGSGQLAFPLLRWFGEVWAVDQEPDMVSLVRAKAATVAKPAARGAGCAPVVRAITSAAEALDTPPSYFSLVVIGNAFHRLDRDLVAARILSWLLPGGHLALCWSTTPWMGDAPWQRTFSGLLDRWRSDLGVSDRVPPGWDTPRSLRPDGQVLADAGFAAVERREFAVSHRWSVPELAGFVRSTSFLPAAVLGDRTPAFEADLAAVLAPYASDGRFAETVSCAYELARKPG